MLKKYLNGNYLVSLDEESGTKIYRGLRHGEELVSSFPDSIDLKITNKCSIGCPYCHESSSINGKSFDLNKTIKLLDGLPKVGIEVAIGGGDVLEIGDDLAKLTNWLINNNFAPRITVNYKSLEKIVNDIDEDKELYHSLIKDNYIECRDFGISIEKYDEKRLSYIENTLSELALSRIVIHVIIGIIPLDDLEKLLESKRRVLILGYKSWGRGKSIGPEKEKIKEYEKLIKRAIFRARKNGILCTLGFDNLAIEQLNLKDSFTEKEWNRIYMGNEFTHTMYIDAVREEFAPTSRDPERKPWSDFSGGIIEYFQKNKQK